MPLALLQPLLPRLGLVLLMLAPGRLPASQEATPQPAPAAPQDGAAETRDLATLLTEDGRFGLLLELLERAQLSDRLTGTEPFTLIAPTDEAFEALRPETLEVLRLASGSLLRELLGAHAIEGRWTLADMGELARIPSVQGHELALRQMSPGSYALDAAMLVEVDLEASNGVVHVIDGVLQPAGLGIIDEAALYGSGRLTYEIDLTHSTILFRVMHMEVGAQWGQFRNFQGELMVDSEHPERSEVLLAVDVASIDTGNSDRDGYLCSGDFFDTDAFPGMTFRSLEVAPREGGDLEVTGELSLLGVTQSVTCLVRKLGEGRFGPRHYKVGYETEFTVRRSDFGMGFGIPGVAGDEVRLVVALEGTRSVE
jgi:polyisoprenoid-binding protein YceI/uncharacterized surface protein with fasciclin (FAS1) repeats